MKKVLSTLLLGILAAIATGACSHVQQASINRDPAGYALPGSNDSIDTQEAGTWPMSN